MGQQDEGAKPDAAVDARYEWLKERVCSSLRVKEEQFQRLLQGEARCVFLRLQCVQ
jgi:hypothetical protein